MSDSLSTAELFMHTRLSSDFAVSISRGCLDTSGKKIVIVMRKDVFGECNSIVSFEV